MIELHPAQATIASNTKRFRVVCAGRRFGKSILSAWEMFGYAIQKECRVAYLAPTYQSARDIVWAELKKICEPVAVSINESRLEITVRNKQGTESLIILRGWEAVETLRGQKFVFLVLDEVAMYRNFWEGWQEVLRPTLTDERGDALFISTPRGFNHFYDLYNLANTDENYHSFHFTTRDNPFIPPDEIDTAQKELTEDRFAQEYLADFRKTEGLVYKEFNRDRHLVSTDIEVYTKYFAGVDFGFTNPAAVISIKKDRDARYFVYPEWYKTGQTDAQIAEYVSACKFNEVYPDPESAGGIEELRRKGVNVRDVIKNKDSIRNGINIVRELFKANRLFIHKDCINLIQELETYAYPDKKPDRNEQENPIKENDHALDALRYALSMESVGSVGGGVSIHKPSYSGFNKRGYPHKDN